jgi:hypothetical protein
LDAPARVFWRRARQPGCLSRAPEQAGVVTRAKRRSRWQNDTCRRWP